MNNQNEALSTSNPQDTHPDAAPSRTIFLDKSFPSLTVIGGGIFLMVVFFVLSGWKIVNLEQERASLVEERTSIAKDRARLDEDLTTHGKILNQLPELRRQRQEAESSLAGTQIAMNAAEIQLKAMEGKLAKAMEEFRNVQSRQDDAQGQLTANQKKTAELQKEQSGLIQKNDALSLSITKLQKQQEITQQEATSEQGRLMVLKDSIAQLEKRRSELDATLAELPKRLADLTKQIEKDAGVASNSLLTAGQQVAADVKGLNSAAKQADDAVTALHKGLGQLDGLAQRFAERQKDLDKATGSFGKTAAEFSSTTEDKLTPAVDALKEKSGQVSELAKRLADEQKQLSGNADILGKSVETLASLNGKIKAAGDALATSQKVLEETTARLDAGTGRLENASKDLAAREDTVAQAVESLTAASLNAKAAGENFGAISKSLQEFSTLDAAVLQAVDVLTSASRGIKSAGDELGEAVKSLQAIRHEMEAAMKQNPDLPDQTEKSKPPEPSAPASEKAKRQ